MPTGATPALTIGATPAEDFAVLHDKARHIAAVSLIGNKTAAVRGILLLTISGFLLGPGAAGAPRSPAGGRGGRLQPLNKALQAELLDRLKDTEVRV